MSRISARIVFSKGEGLSIHDTFKDIVATLLEDAKFKDLDPLKIVFTTGKTFYFERHKFLRYHQGELDFADLVQETECDGLYRNKAALKSKHGYEVEPDSLWLLQGDTLELVHEDEYVACEFNTAANLFYEI
jgi:hypothetical protein